MEMLFDNYFMLLFFSMQKGPLLLCYKSLCESYSFQAIVNHTKLCYKTICSYYIKGTVHLYMYNTFKSFFISIEANEVKVIHVLHLFVLKQLISGT